MQQLIVDDDLREIARRIAAKTQQIGRTGWVWNEDEFQIGHFSGGFVPDNFLGHPAFFFSFHAPDGNDYIFAMTFEDVELVLEQKPFQPSLEFWKKSPLGTYGTKPS